MSGRNRPLAAILGCGGPRLSERERAFFRDADPYGFVLFQRNCEDPDQVRGLVAALRETVGRSDAPVLIDQEGGRVRRLKPPHWPEHPAAARFGALAARDPDRAEIAVRLHATAVAAMLSELHIDVDAAPVLDLALRGASDVVGDRAFGDDPATVARLGRATCEGFLDGGVLPIIKHMPGHGRATVDSHHALPVVTADLDSLAAADFGPFRALADAPWGMTGHIVLAAVDPDRPATQSPLVIERIIRGAIGFDGVLVSDDLSMNALSGTLGQRAATAVAAGCDLALHCNGVFAEMMAVAAAAPALADRTIERLRRGEDRRRRPDAIDPVATLARVDAMLAA